MFNPDREPKQENRLEKIELTEEEKFLITLIKARGIEDLEINKMFIDWYNKQQTIIDKSENFNLANINFLRRKAYIFLEVGYFDEMEDEFE
ncbi:MAG TPA: hypothetical protein PLK76_00510 [bacterium]|nr:hypothetical protein [bacterium]